MTPQTINVRVKDSVFNPSTSDRTIVVRRADATGGKPALYRVYLYLEGDDLPFVESVRYLLHESFDNRERTIVRSPSNPNCELVIWTWGLFRVTVTINDKRGQSFALHRDLQYDRELKSSGAKYQYQ